jgi:hypothetical protein
VSDQGLSGEVIKSRGQLQSFNFVKKSLPKSQPTKRPAPKVYSNEKVAEQISEENLILLSKYEDLYKVRPSILGESLLYFNVIGRNVMSRIFTLDFSFEMHRGGFVL